MEVLQNARRRLHLLMATAILSVAALTPAVAEESPRYYGGGHMWDGGWGMVFGPIWMIFFLAILVGLVVLIVRWLSGPSAGGLVAGGLSKTALDILRERFARGEIDKDEFEERKRLLGG